MGTRSVGAATGDGGNDRNGSAVRDRGVEGVEEADGLFGLVDVDEAPHALVVAQVYNTIHALCSVPLSLYTGKQCIGPK